MTIKRIETIAEEIKELTLVPNDESQFPDYSAGAHIDLHLGEDLIRQYSLTGFGAANEYRIAVGLDANSRGGSKSVHDDLREGMNINISAPRNNFELTPEGESYLFIAGGIGLTPLIPMIQWCEANKKNWRAIIAARSASRIAYREEIQKHGDRIQWHHDDENEGKPLEVKTCLGEYSADNHVYCCGPTPLMEAVRDATDTWPSGNVHFEWFSADPELDNAENEPFDIVLDSSGTKLHVPADKSVLQVLRDNGVPVASVCSEGICGTCETYVLSGDIIHRDQVLTDDERESGEIMMVCCSRGRGELVLDL